MSELSKDALALLQDTARKAAAPVALKIDGRTTEAHFALDGRLESLPIQPDPRSHRVATIDDLIAAAIHYATADDEAVVWFCRHFATVVLNDARDREDRVSCPLDASREYLTLERLDTERRYISQRDFLRLLRLDLGLPWAALDPFRRLDWTNRTGGKTEMGHGKESLGRAIESQVTAGEADLPEFLNVEIPIYRTPGETTPYAIRCVLDFDATNGLILMAPASGELERVTALHLEDLRHRLETGLRAAEIAVFQGTP